MLTLSLTKKKQFQNVSFPFTLCFVSKIYFFIKILKKQLAQACVTQFGVSRNFICLDQPRFCSSHPREDSKVCDITST